MSTLEILATICLVLLAAILLPVGYGVYRLHRQSRQLAPMLRIDPESLKQQLAMIERLGEVTLIQQLAETLKHNPALLRSVSDYTHNQLATALATGARSLSQRLTIIRERQVRLQESLTNSTLSLSWSSYRQELGVLKSDETKLMEELANINAAARRFGVELAAE